jgi:hypothetical protein
MKFRRLWAFALGFVLAASAWGFRVEPARLDLTINRGESPTVILTLRGSRDAGSEDILVYPTDVLMNRRGELDFKVIEGTKHTLIPWLSVGEKQLTVNENTVREYRFRISVPRDASPGEYYAMLMLEPARPNRIRDAKRPLELNVISRVAVPIIVNVPGRVYKKQGQLIDLKTIQREDGKVVAAGTYFNTGSIHLEVEGQVFIKTEDRKKVLATIPLRALNAPEKKGFILPDHMRDFEGISDRPLPLSKGRYFAEFSFDCGNFPRLDRGAIPFSVDKPLVIAEAKGPFFSLDPSKIQFKYTAGRPLTLPLKISNIGFASLRLAASGDAAWARISPSSFLLKSGETRDLSIVVSPSKDQKGVLKARFIFKADQGADLTLDIELVEAEAPAKK